MNSRSESQRLRQECPSSAGGLQHHEPQSLLGQVPGHGQAGLTGTDHDDIERLIGPGPWLVFAPVIVPLRGPR